MDGHPMMAAKIQHTTKTPIRQPTGLFEKNPLFDDIDQTINKRKKGTEGASGNIRDNIGMDIAFGMENLEEPKNHLHLATNLEYQYESPTSNYLIGPMIVRVMPDGSPVAGEMPKLPVDDDLDAMTLGSNGLYSTVKVPSTRLEAPVIPDIYSTQGTFGYTNHRTNSRVNRH